MLKLNEILFWSERDDSEDDETSSKDPLGTETFAGQLAELILPGLTSLTRSIRYVTLVCLWLDFIEKKFPDAGASEQLEYIKKLEKLTAYCVAKKHDDDSGQTDGLLGKRYAKAYIDKRTEKFKIDRLNYPFLVNHGAAGAFAFYKVLVKAIGFIDSTDDFELSYKGRDLIDGLQIPHSSFIEAILNGEAQDSSSKKFETLGEFFGLKNFNGTISEKVRIKKELLSNPIRNASFKLIKKVEQKDTKLEIDIISEIAMASSEDVSVKQVATISDYITRFERLNRELHYIFYSLMGIKGDHISTEDFVQWNDIHDSLKSLTGKALDAYLDFHADNEQQLRGNYDKRVYSLFRKISDVRDNNVQCIRTILDHHIDIQKHKRKARWIEYKGIECTVILRRYRKEKEEVKRIQKEGIHGYRTYNARRMINELGI